MGHSANASGRVRLAAARSQEEFAIARGLFEEYAARLGVDLCFQGFGSELKMLESMYATPEGCLILVWLGDAAVGCGGVRRRSGEECEMKRLYVRDELRGLGIGRRLAEALLERARQLGYRRMVLDTLEGMAEARRLYESLGFRACAPYYDNPLSGVVYMEFDLAASPRGGLGGRLPGAGAANERRPCQDSFHVQSSSKRHARARGQSPRRIRRGRARGQGRSGRHHRTGRMGALLDTRHRRRGVHRDLSARVLAGDGAPGRVTASDAAIAHAAADAQPRTQRSDRYRKHAVPSGAGSVHPQDLHGAGAKVRALGPVRALRGAHDTDREMSASIGGARAFGSSMESSLACTVSMGMS